MSNLHLPHDHGDRIKTVLSHIPETESFSQAAKLFHLLGDGTRLKLFWILCHCEECVINLSAAIDMSSPAISHHLRLLKDSSLIVCRREGKEVYYKAASTPIANELHDILESLSTFSCPGKE